MSAHNEISKGDWEFMTGDEKASAQITTVPVVDVDEHELDDRHKALHTSDLEGAVTNEDDLRQGFSIGSLLAVALMLGGAWAAVPQVFSTTIVYGGNRLLIYGQFAAGIAFQAIGTSLAELASAWPTSSGPQEWAFQLFPRRFKRVGSYFVAWNLSLLYLFATMACTTLLAKQVIGLAAFLHPEYMPTKLHVWLVNAGLIITGGLVNLFGIKLMHKFQTFGLIWFCVGFLLWIIVPVSVSPRRASAAEVFGDTVLATGWGPFVSFMIGLNGVCAGFGVPDVVTHLGEETDKPAVDIPRAMIVSPALSTVTATILTISVLFCGVDLLTMAASPTGVPYVEFLGQTLHSDAGVICMTVIILYSQFMSCFDCQLAVSRTVFTFAREGGAFLPKYLGAVHPTLRVPVWSVLLTTGFCLAFSLILLGSPTAVNSLLGCVATLMAYSYLPLIGMHLLNGRKFNPGPIHLGRWGWLVNGVAVAWLAFVVVFWHFPYTMPFDKESMNYNIVIVPGLLLLGAVSWFFSGRKSYIIHRKIE